MKILITNVELLAPSGTTTYVRDLAIELKRQGHEPFVYTCAKGTVAREIERAGIVVTRNIRRKLPVPDVIHGHQWLPTLSAIRRFPSVPAIYICHNHASFLDRAVIHPQVRRYFGVSQLCIDRLIGDGVSAQDIALLQNWVDLRRFQPRDVLRARPLRALVFSNYAHAGTHLPAVTEACRRAGLELDVMGKAAGTASQRPESALPRYDIVFAKAKAAMEAMATGAAVILCDFGGAGPLVTAGNFDRLRPMNFGFEALSEPLAPEYLSSQIALYDAADAARVSARLRDEASLETAARHLCEIYRDAIRDTPPSSTIRERLRGSVGMASGKGPSALLRAKELVRARLFEYWLRLPDCAQRVLRSLPGVEEVLLTMRDMRF